MIPNSIMTYNVCSFAPDLLKRAGVEEEIGWKAKSESVLKVLENNNTTFVALQEVEDHMMPQLWERLGKLGYRIIYWSYNYRFMNALAYKANEFALDSFEKWWSNPENPDRPGDPQKGHARVVIMGKFYPVLQTSKTKEPDYSQDPIFVLNGHPGLKHLERMGLHQISIRKISEKVKAGHVFFCMDMNCFKDDGGDKEVELFKTNGFTDLTAVLKSETGLELDGTFVGRLGQKEPVDKFIPPTGEVGGRFDRIKYIAIAVKSIAERYRCVVDLKKYNGKPEPKEITSVKQLLVGPDGEDRRNEFPSDHFPVKVVLREERKEDR